jgi:hypothetical protein
MLQIPVEFDPPTRDDITIEGTRNVLDKPRVIVTFSKKWIVVHHCVVPQGVKNEN